MIKYRSKETRNKGGLLNILTNAAKISKKKKNDKLLENLTMTATATVVRVATILL